MPCFERNGGTFFFSSRRRHTRSDRDWSSDVCSSDLHDARVFRIHGDIGAASILVDEENALPVLAGISGAKDSTLGLRPVRSEERRVGKECRSRWSPYH